MLTLKTLKPSIFNSFKKLRLALYLLETNRNASFIAEGRGMVIVQKECLSLHSIILPS